MSKWYKVLRDDGTAIFQSNYSWSLPTQRDDGSYKPGRWHSNRLPPLLCKSGFHLTKRPYIWYSSECLVFEAEGAGESVGNEEKTAFQRARLLKPVPHPQWWINARRFVKEELSEVNFLQPDGNPDPEWELVTAPTWRDALQKANELSSYGERSRLNLLMSKVDSIAFHNYRNTHNQIGAYFVTKEECHQKMVLKLNEAMVRNQQGFSAFILARHAGNYCCANVLCADLLSKDDLEFSRKCWEVWQKGYALAADIRGKLVVFAAEGSKNA